MWCQLRIALIFLGLFTIIVGVIYPLAVTGIAQTIFHHQANGSTIEADGKSLGSELIGQQFSHIDNLRRHPLVAINDGSETNQVFVDAFNSR